MEEIYESPDVPNILTSKITKQQQQQQQQQQQEITSEFIDNTNLHPDHAFEVFASASNRLLGLSSSNNINDEIISIYSKLDNNERILETPIQKFTRLRSEFNDLETNLNTLQKQYDETSTTTKLSSSSSSSPSSTATSLSSWSNIQKEVSKLKEKDSQMKSLQVIDDDVMNIEKRLRLLEQLLGYSSNTLDNNMDSQMKYVYPLLDTVSILEGKSAYLEQSNIDNLKMKVYSLKKELETSLSIRDTKINKISILDQKAVEYIHKIDDIKKKVDQIENVVYQFPSIILRLKSLESTHSKAANISSKLNDIEGKIFSVKGNLLENAEIINTLKSGLHENSQVLKQNVNTVLKNI